MSTIEILGKEYQYKTMGKRVFVVQPGSGLYLANGANEDEAREYAIQALKVALSLVRDVKKPVNKTPSLKPVNGLSQAQAIAICKNFIFKGRCTLQVLKNVRVIAKNGTVQYFATNLEEFISLSVPGAGECNITVPPDQLKPGEYSQNDKTMSLKIGALSINGIDSQEMPPEPTIEGESLTLPLEIIDALPIVLKSASRDEDRPVLMGIQLMVTDGVITGIQSTDGFKIMRYGTGNPSHIIAARSLEKLSKLRKYISADVPVTVGESMVKYGLGFATMYSLKIEGRYPQVDQITPIRNKMAMVGVFNAEDVRVALAELKPIYTAVRMVVRINRLSDHMELLSMSEETGTGEVSVKGHTNIDPNKKIGIVIAFNGNFLADVLPESGKFKMYSDRPDRPAMIEFDKYKAIVMPMHR